MSYAPILPIVRLHLRKKEKERAYSKVAGKQVLWNLRLHIRPHYNTKEAVLKFISEHWPGQVEELVLKLIGHRWGSLF